MGLMVNASFWWKGLECGQLAGVSQTNSYRANYLPLLVTLGARLGEASLAGNTVCIAGHQSSGDYINVLGSIHWLGLKAVSTFTIFVF